MSEVFFKMRLPAIRIMYRVFVDLAVFDMRCYHNLTNKSKES